LEVLVLQLGPNWNQSLERKLKVPVHCSLRMGSIDQTEMWTMTMVALALKKNQRVVSFRQLILHSFQNRKLVLEPKEQVPLLQKTEV
jgi:hypothetical protein